MPSKIAGDRFARSQRSSSGEYVTAATDAPSDSASSSETSGVEGSDSEMLEDEESQHAQPMSDDLRHISFGALAEAQDSLEAQQTRGHRSVDRQTAFGEEKATILRARLAELRRVKASSSKPAASTKSDSSDDEENSGHRTSKHAPASQSSKYAVSRYRPVLPLSSNPQNVRDPRFSSVSTNAGLDEDRLRKQYGFLSAYRNTELSELKAAFGAIKAKAKKRKSGQMTNIEMEEVEQLKRQINSIENKKKSEEKKERERDIVRRHRKQEREQIKLGKKPFYLKRGEAKKQAEQQKWDSLKGRDQKKLQERREKKQSQKQRRAGTSLNIG